MALQTEMHVIKLSDLSALSDSQKAAGSRFVQMHCVCADDGVFDVIYTWMGDDLVMKNYKIEQITSRDVIPSITNNFLAAFVFENEAHDLFGANIEGISRQQRQCPSFRLPRRKRVKKPRKLQLQKLRKRRKKRHLRPLPLLPAQTQSLRRN